MLPPPTFNSLPAPRLNAGALAATASKGPLCSCPPRCIARRPLEAEPPHGSRQTLWRIDAQQSADSGRPPSGSAASTSSSNVDQPRDPPDSAYPSRDFAAGGWAGGEIGLQEFIEANPPPELDKAQESTREASSSGAQTASRGDIRPEQYPSKTSIGPLEGITGGFAGGEKGVQQFVEKGTIKFTDKGSTQVSPLAVAGIAGVGITAGAVLLNSDGVEYGDKVFGLMALPQVRSTNISLAKVPDSVVQAGFIGLALAGALVGASLVVRKAKSDTDLAVRTALNGVRIVAFWLGVFIAVKFVLEAS